jgi:hypothetical protein
MPEGVRAVAASRSAAKLQKLLAAGIKQRVKDLHMSFGLRDFIDPGGY